LRKKTDGGSANFALPRRRSNVQPHRLFALSQTQSVEQQSANSRVYDQAISAFKSRNGATGPWSDDSIDCAMVIPELPKATLHSGNH